MQFLRLIVETENSTLKQENYVKFTDFYSVAALVYNILLIFYSVCYIDTPFCDNKYKNKLLTFLFFIFCP